CIVAAALSWRDPAVEMRSGWAVGAAIVSVLAVIVTGLRVNADFDRGGSAGPGLQLAGAIAALVIVVFAVESLRRSTVAKGRQRRRSAPDDEAAARFLARFDSLYEAALIQIEAATA